MASAREATPRAETGAEPPAAAERAGAGAPTPEERARERAHGAPAAGESRTARADTAPPEAGGHPGWALLGLALVLVAGLLLRLDNIAHGLPFVYHADEAFHFTSRAVAMFGGDLNPHYFQNPSAFTYLVHGVLRVTEGGDAVAAFRLDPTDAFVAARVLAAVLCMLGVAAVFAVGRRLWSPSAGLAAAAILAFAFLPTAYSRFALTDVGAFLPIALAAYAIVRVHETGARRWFLAAGAAIGVATGFKYTAGLLVVPLGAAAVLRARDGQAGVWKLGALGLLAAGAAFLITTPYFLLDAREALFQLKQQAQAAGEPKLGPQRDGTVVFYARTLTWGLGWGAAAAALAGLVWQWRRDRVRAVLLALFPLLLFVYIAFAERMFARWLMPAYPLLALLAGAGLAWLAATVSRRPAVRALVLVGLLAAVLAQPIAEDVHVARVLGRTDTRQLARDWVRDTPPAGTRVVVEPAFPSRFFRGLGLRIGFGPLPKSATVRGGSVTRFVAALRPERIDRYRAAGYCTVISTSDVRERALARGRPRIVAYYRRLARGSRVVFRASPYRRGAAPVPFDFDLSTHLFEPSAYARPGPEVTIRRLRRCGGPDGA